MLVHKDALLVHEVTTAQDTRYFLNGALFDKDGRAVATDGKVLVRFASAKIDPASFPAIEGSADVGVSADVIVSREDLAAVLSTAAKSSQDISQAVAIIPNGESVTLATARHDRTVQIKARKVEGHFPAYERVLAVDKPVVATVFIDPAFLETLGRIARKAGARHIKFEIHGTSTEITDQLLFTAECTNGTLDGALMPMRP